MRGLLRNYVLRVELVCSLSFQWLTQPTAEVLLGVTQIYLQLDLVILKVFSHLNDSVIL